MCLTVLLLYRFCRFFFLFFFNDTATTEIYTLSLHDALPISAHSIRLLRPVKPSRFGHWSRKRSEEHTSELQSLAYLVCRLLLEKKKKLLKFNITIAHQTRHVITNTSLAASSSRPLQQRALTC